MAYMNHPELDAVIEVPDSAVPFHLVSGWRECDAPVEAVPTTEVVVADQATTDETVDGDKASARSSKSNAKES